MVDLYQICITAVIALVLIIVVTISVRGTQNNVNSVKVSAGGPPFVKIAPKPKPQGPFTIEEISKHKSADDLWLIIEGKVYDFTTYIREHPGGDAIFNDAGGDATQGFKGDQHPHKVWELLPEYYIGDVKQADN